MNLFLLNQRYAKLKKEGKNFEVLFLISENRMYDAYKVCCCETTEERTKCLNTMCNPLASGISLAFNLILFQPQDDMPWVASIINSKQRRDLCIKVGVASV